MAVGNPRCAPVEDQQAGTVTRLGWMLGDAFGGERVVEIRSTHGLSREQPEDEVEDQGEEEAEKDGGGDGDEASDASGLETKVSRESSGDESKPCQEQDDAAHCCEAYPSSDEPASDLRPGYHQAYRSGNRRCGSSGASKSRCA